MGGLGAELAAVEVVPGVDFHFAGAGVEGSDGGSVAVASYQAYNDAVGQLGGGAACRGGGVVLGAVLILQIGAQGADSYLGAYFYELALADALVADVLSRETVDAGGGGVPLHFVVGAQEGPVVAGGRAGGDGCGRRAAELDVASCRGQVEVRRVGGERRGAWLGHRGYVLVAAVLDAGKRVERAVAFFLRIVERQADGGWLTGGERAVEGYADAAHAVDGGEGLRSVVLCQGHLLGAAQRLAGEGVQGITGVGAAVVVVGGVDGVGGGGVGEEAGERGGLVVGGVEAGGADGDAVGGGAPAEEVVAVGCIDGVAVGGGGGDGAAVVVDVPAGIDGIGIGAGGGGAEGAAVDGDGAVTCIEGDGIVSIDVGCDVSAVDGEGIYVDAMVNHAFGIDAEGAVAVAAAVGLAGDVEGRVAAEGDAVAVDSPFPARSDVHVAVVGEDEGDVACEGEFVVELDGGQSCEVCACGEAGLRAVEGDGVGLAGGAVGVDVGYGDGLAGAVDGFGGSEGLAVAVGGDGEAGYGCAGEEVGVTRVGVGVQQLVAEGCTGGVSLRRAAGKG